MQIGRVDVFAVIEGVGTQVVADERPVYPEVVIGAAFESLPGAFHTRFELDFVWKVVGQVRLEKEKMPVLQVVAFADNLCIEGAHKQRAVILRVVVVVEAVTKFGVPL